MTRKKEEYEKQYQRLQKVVAQLEQGTGTLDESLKLFQEGVALYRACKSELETAELQVNQWMAESETAKEGLERHEKAAE